MGMMHMMQRRIFIQTLPLRRISSHNILQTITAGKEIGEGSECIKVEPDKKYEPDWQHPRPNVPASSSKHDARNAEKAGSYSSTATEHSVSSPNEELTAAFRQYQK